MTLQYTDHDGLPRVVEGCKLYQDKAGKYWLWSEQLEQNLAYKEKTLEDALKSSIDSLLFILQLKEERIKKLQFISEKVSALIEQVGPVQDDL